MDHVIAERVAPDSLGRCISPKVSLSSASYPQLSNATTLYETRQRLELLPLVPNENEAKLFDLLCAVIRHFGLSTTMRVAGGWVRDKLIGRHSDDIDIALDDCLGREFAEKVNEYLAEHGLEHHRIGVIKSNPEQSKHLETATMQVLGVWVDFINLRSEQYAADSRIPSEMSIGTPLQDAQRRDLTINSLFYNINTRKIEDMTGQGLSDLEHCIIRTPLAPRSTFLDDPLRVLRAIRFAARLRFRIDPDLIDAAKDPVILEALTSKVSRERVWSELSNMLGGKDVDHAFLNILNFNLYSAIVKLPPTATPALDPFDHELHARSYAYLHQLHRFWSYFEFEIDTERRRETLLAAFLLPLAAFTYTNEKRRVLPLISFVMKEGLKASTKESDHVLLLATTHDAMIKLIGTEFSTEAEQRRAYGLLLRTLGESWSLSLALAIAVALNHNEDMTLSQAKVAYDIVTDAVASLALHDVWRLRPLITGAEIAKLFNRKPGPELSKILQFEIEWQLMNPMLGRAECELALQAYIANTFAQ